MKRATFRIVRLTWLVAAGAGCIAQPESASQSTGTTEVTSSLFANTGTLLWSSGLGAAATVPVCFVTRPIKMVDGSVRCPFQTPGTDCNGVSAKTVNGVTTAFNASFLQGLVGELNQDNWMRYANIEFIGWGGCPIDPVTQMHIEANLKSTVMVEFGDGDFTHPEGKSTTAATHIQNNWYAMETQSDQDSGNVVHEMGHALGFEHEWLRPDWTGWKCQSGAMNSNIAGLCLDVVGGSASPGTPVQL